MNEKIISLWQARVKYDVSARNKIKLQRQLFIFAFRLRDFALTAQLRPRLCSSLCNKGSGVVPKSNIRMIYFFKYSTKERVYNCSDYIT